MGVIEDIQRYASILARRKGRNDTDDIVAEALLGYAKASAKLKTLCVENPAAYIQAWVTGSIKKAMSKVHTTLPLTEDAAVYTMDYSHELIEAMHLSYTEQEVLSLRLQGYVDHEIGEKIRMSQAGVHKARNRIRNKFVEMMSENP